MNNTIKIKDIIESEFLYEKAQYEKIAEKIKEINLIDNNELFLDFEEIIWIRKNIYKKINNLLCAKTIEHNIICLFKNYTNMLILSKRGIFKTILSLVKKNEEKKNVIVETSAPEVNLSKHKKRYLNRKEEFKQYYLKNKEKLNKKSKEWAEKNPEVKKELDRKYRENNKEKIAEKKREAYRRLKNNNPK